MSSGYSLGAFLCLFSPPSPPTSKHGQPQVWIGMILEIAPIGNLVFFTFSWLSARVNLNLPPHILLRMSAVALQLSSLPFLRRMTRFVSLSSQAMLSMHSIISFSVTLLREGCLCVCVWMCLQPILAQGTTRMPATREEWKGKGNINLPSKSFVLINYASFWLALKTPICASQLGRKHVIWWFLWEKLSLG